MKLDFRLPRRVRLVYFGRIGLGILHNYITEPSFAIYENPRERLNVWVAFRMLLCGERSELSYYRSFLRWTKPRVVITMEDNNVTFFATKMIMPSCKTLAIQNGLRKSLSHAADSSFMDDLRKVTAQGYGADVIATLGGLGNDFFVESFARSLPRLVEVGNVMNNALELQHTALSNEPRRIIFVSKFPNRGTAGIDESWHSKTMIFSGSVGFTADKYFKVDSIVARVCAEVAASSSMSFLVIGKRPAWQTGEYEYFKRHLDGLPWSFLPSHTQASSYEAVRPSDIIVNVDSTIGYELFARGLRVGFITARMSVAGHPEIREFEFGHPLITEPTGPYWTNEATESEIRRVVDFLASVSDDAWEQETRTSRELLFHYDPLNVRLCRVLTELGVANTGARLWSRELIPAN